MGAIIVQEILKMRAVGICNSTIEESTGPTYWIVKGVESVGF